MLAGLLLVPEKGVRHPDANGLKLFSVVVSIPGNKLVRLSHAFFKIISCFGVRGLWSGALLICGSSVKAGLHYGDYRSKLVPFEAQKNIF